MAILESIIDLCAYMHDFQKFVKNDPHWKILISVMEALIELDDAKLDSLEI